MKKNSNIEIPVCEKYCLTILEAAAYSNIGTAKLYEMTSSPKCSFVLYDGKKKLIKRAAFEKAIDNMTFV